MSGEGPVKVLIVDDMRTVRALLRAHLATDPRITVVGEAADALEARAQIKALRPDVITLDVELPNMNGLEFLEKLMRLRPMPVVMISTRTTEQSEVAIKALSLGAVDCIDLHALRVIGPGNMHLADTLVMAACARLATSKLAETTPVSSPHVWNGKTVLIGSSTGGVEALMTVIGAFPANCPPTLIAQHMPAPFLKSFCKRLDRNVRAKVVLAQDGSEINEGTIYLAPGGRHHLTLTGHANRRIQLVANDGTEAHVPSVNLLFKSAADRADEFVAVILTGMGRDGADAMRELRVRGAHTITQSGGTAVVDGMPKAARDIHAALEIVDLAYISASILAATSQKHAGRLSYLRATRPARMPKPTTAKMKTRPAVSRYE